jgi:hypothetical protein
MATPATIPLRAPGVYLYPDTPLLTLTGVRMDVCAFAGVAPRGPARVPVVNEKWPDTVPQTEPARPINRTQAYVVESFTAYQQLYGGFEGGLLPYAVASFFEQGGARAYIARIVHDYGAGNPLNAARVAIGTVLGATTSAGPASPLIMRARNEGLWGNLLQVQLSFQTSPIAFDSATATQVIFDVTAEISVGEMLRLTMPDGSQVLRVITALISQPRPDQFGTQLLGILEAPAPGIAVAAEIVTGTLDVDDGANNTEEHTALGLSSLHPRWMATVLCNESALLFPDALWSNAEIIPDSVNLNTVVPRVGQFRHGCDVWSDITPADFFDLSWSITDEDPGQGVQCFAQLEDLTILAVPDLYSPAPLTPVENIIDPVSLAGPDFETCVDIPVSPPKQGVGSYDLSGLRLDPLDPTDLQTITGLQRQLVAFAEAVQQFVVLLDVPPGLTQRRILNWRAAFNSSYAACYHPWLDVSRRTDAQNSLVRIPPSAPAAGIIAATAIQFGVPTGPANVLVAQAVDVSDVVSPARHDQLHPLGINVYLRDRDGVRLTAARTLSRDPQYRQLTVRRLITLLRLTLYQQMQWAVFEPNNAALRLEIRLLLTGFLRTLFRRGAFSGATEATSFFVRCDETNNPQYITDSGMLIAEIGVAPSEPIEFIVIRLSRSADGTLSVQD